MTPIKINNQKGGLTTGICFFLALILLICGGVFYTGSHHFVKTRDGIKIYPKKKFSFEEPYVDMENMKFRDLRNHKQIVSAMIAHKDIEFLPGGESLTVLSKAGKSVTDAIKKFDHEFQLKNSLKNISRIAKEKLENFDAKYEISKKVDATNTKIKDIAKQLNDWLKNNK